MNCVYCQLYLSHVSPAEYIIKGMSLCGLHYHEWEDGKFDIPEVEKGMEIKDE